MVLRADCDNIPDGAIASVGITRRGDSASLVELDGDVTDGAATALWRPTESDFADGGSPEVDFVVQIDGQTARSPFAVVVSFFECVVRDSGGQGLAGVRFRMAFSDGTSREVESDSGGAVRNEYVPIGMVGVQILDLPSSQSESSDTSGPSTDDSEYVCKLAANELFQPHDLETGRRWTLIVPAVPLELGIFIGQGAERTIDAEVVLMAGDSEHLVIRAAHGEDDRP